MTYSLIFSVMFTMIAVDDFCREEQYINEQTPRSYESQKLVVYVAIKAQELPLSLLYIMAVCAG